MTRENIFLSSSVHLSEPTRSHDSDSLRVTEVETVRVTLNIPKPVLHFFQLLTEIYGTSGNTVEECALAALIDGVDAKLNDFENECREKIIQELDLDKVLQ